MIKLQTFYPERPHPFDKGKIIKLCRQFVPRSAFKRQLKYDAQAISASGASSEQFKYGIYAPRLFCTAMNYLWFFLFRHTVEGEVVMVDGIIPYKCINVFNTVRASEKKPFMLHASHDYVQSFSKASRREFSFMNIPECDGESHWITYLKITHRKIPNNICDVRAHTPHNIKNTILSALAASRAVFFINGIVEDTEFDELHVSSGDQKKSHVIPRVSAPKEEALYLTFQRDVHTKEQSFAMRGAFQTFRLTHVMPLVYTSPRADSEKRAEGVYVDGQFMELDVFAYNDLLESLLEQLFQRAIEKNLAFIAPQQWQYQIQNSSFMPSPSATFSVVTFMPVGDQDHTMTNDQKSEVYRILCKAFINPPHEIMHLQQTIEERQNSTMKKTKRRLTRFIIRQIRDDWLISRSNSKKKTLLDKQQLVFTLAMDKHGMISGTSYKHQIVMNTMNDWKNLVRGFLVQLVIENREQQDCNSQCWGEEYQLMKKLAIKLIDMNVGVFNHLVDQYLKMHTEIATRKEDLLRKQFLCMLNDDSKKKVDAKGFEEQTYMAALTLDKNHHEAFLAMQKIQQQMIIQQVTIDVTFIDDDQREILTLNDVRHLTFLIKRQSFWVVESFLALCYILELFDLFPYVVNIPNTITFNLGINTKILCCVYENREDQSNNPSRGQKLIRAHRLFKSSFQQRIYMYVAWAKAQKAKHVKFEYVDNDLQLFRPSKRELWTHEVQKLYQKSQKTCVFC